MKPTLFCPNLSASLRTDVSSFSSYENCVPVFIELETFEQSIRLKGLRRYAAARPEARNDRTVNGEDFRDPLFVRTSNIATTHQFSIL